MGTAELTGDWRADAVKRIGERYFPEMMVELIFRYDLLYSAGWATGWVFLRDKVGEWLGSLIGTLALGLTLGTAFDAPKQTLKIIGALFLARSAGYFLGEFLQHAVPGFAGRVLWGATYGLGLGAGIGYSLYACQQPLRERLRQRG